MKESFKTLAVLAQYCLNGFICGYLLPAGNRSDSAMLLPTVLNVYKTTNIMPLLVSSDDVYASEKVTAYIFIHMIKKEKEKFKQWYMPVKQN